VHVGEAEPVGDPVRVALVDLETAASAWLQTLSSST
jgi:hypothetical protein